MSVQEDQLHRQIADETRITHYEVPVEDVTDKIFMALALGDGTHRGVRVSLSGAGSKFLILLSSEGYYHMQFAVDMSALAAQLVDRFWEEHGAENE